MDDLNSEYRSLQSKHRDFTQKHHQTQRENDKLTTQVEYLSRDLDAMTKELDKIRTDTMSKIHDVTSGYEASTNKLRSENQELAQFIQKLQKESKQSIMKVTKEKTKYKKLAAMGKMRIETKLNDMQNLKAELETIVRTKNYEISTITQKLHEAQRERDEAKFRMSMGTIGVPQAITDRNANLNLNDIFMVGSAGVDDILKKIQNEVSGGTKTNTSQQSPSSPADDA